MDGVLSFGSCLLRIVDRLKQLLFVHVTVKMFLAVFPTANALADRFEIGNLLPWSEQHEVLAVVREWAHHRRLVILGECGFPLLAVAECGRGKPALKHPAFAWIERHPEDAAPNSVRLDMTCLHLKIFAGRTYRFRTLGKLGPHACTLDQMIFGEDDAPIGIAVDVAPAPARELLDNFGISIFEWVHRFLNK